MEIRLNKKEITRASYRFFRRIEVRLLDFRKINSGWQPRLFAILCFILSFLDSILVETFS